MREQNTYIKREICTGCNSTNFPWPLRHLAHQRFNAMNTPNSPRHYYHQTVDDSEMHVNRFQCLLLRLPLSHLRCRSIGLPVYQQRQYDRWRFLLGHHAHRRGGHEAERAARLVRVRVRVRVRVKVRVRIRVKVRVSRSPRRRSARRAARWRQASRAWRSRSSGACLG